MKKILFLVILTAVFTACNTKVKVIDSSWKWNGTFTVVKYVHDWTKNDYREGTAKELTRDTIISGTVVKDTAYEILIHEDSVNKVTKQPAIDSSGRVLRKYGWMLVEKKSGFILQDYKKAFALPAKPANTVDSTTKTNKK